MVMTGNWQEKEVSRIEFTWWKTKQRAKLAKQKLEVQQLGEDHTLPGFESLEVNLTID